MSRPLTSMLEIALESPSTVTPKSPVAGSFVSSNTSS